MIASEYGWADYARPEARRHLLVPDDRHPLLSNYRRALCGVAINPARVEDVEPDERPYPDECLQCQWREAERERDEIRADRDQRGLGVLRARA